MGSGAGVKSSGWRGSATSSGSMVRPAAAAAFSRRPMSVLPLVLLGDVDAFGRVRLHAGLVGVGPAFGELLVVDAWGGVAGLQRVRPLAADQRGLRAVEGGDHAGLSSGLRLLRGGLGLLFTAVVEERVKGVVMAVDVHRPG